MDWDPQSPAVTGLAWPVTRPGGMRLASNVQAGIAAFTSTAAQTVTDVWLYFRDVVGEATYRTAVFAAADLPQGEAQTAIFRPNEDGPAITGCTGSPTNTAGSLYTNIDEATLSTSDYVDMTASSAILDLRCASSGGLGVGSQTVLGVSVVAVVEALGATSGILGFVNLGGTRYSQGDELAITPADGRQTLRWEWLTNPSTNEPWTEAEIQAFDSTDEFGFTSSGAADERVYQAWLEVSYVDGVPLATGDATASTDGWTQFALDASWSKADATAYMTLCRRIGGSGSATWVSLDSTDTMPGGHTAYRPTISRSGAVTALGTVRTEAHAMILTVGGAASADSQPYADLTAVEVHATSTPVQEITMGSTATRGWLQIVARSQHVDGPTDPLLLKVKNSGGTQQGGTLTIPVSAIADAPRKWHVLDGTMATSVSLTNATQYDIEVSCVATDGRGWEVAILSSEAAAVSGETAGFGGTTDRAEEDNDLDMAVVIGTVPTAPADFTATAASDGNDLTWTATSLTTDFVRYEIERLDSDWFPIAYITTEATAAWTDPYARQGVEETYRIRVRHTNGTVSLPSASDTATRTVTQSVIVDSAGTATAVRVQQPGEVGFVRDRAVTRRMGKRFVSIVEAAQDQGASVSSVLFLSPAESDQGWVAGFDDLRAILDMQDDYALLTDFGERLWMRPISDSGTVLLTRELRSPIEFVQTRTTPPITTV